MREEVTKAFRQINEDNTGKISFANLKKMLIEIGETMSDEQIQAMITEADSDGDGQISFEDFFKMMQQAKPL